MHRFLRGISFVARGGRVLREYTISAKNTHSHNKCVYSRSTRPPLLVAKDMLNAHVLFI